MLELLQAKIAETIAKEQELVEIAKEEARRAIGAFPALSSSASTGSLNNGNKTSDVNSNGLPSSRSHPNSNTAQKTHKVLSLHSKSKKATITTYHAPPPPPIPRDDPQVEGPIIHRVPAPSNEVDYVNINSNGNLKALLKESPWANLRRDRPTLAYVPLPPQLHEETGKEENQVHGEKSAAKKQKAKAKSKEKKKEEERIDAIMSQKS